MPASLPARVLAYSHLLICFPTCVCMYEVLSGKTVAHTVSDSDTILDVKRSLDVKLSRELPGISVETMQLIYNGKESKNELTVDKCNYQKGCVVQVLSKGRQGVAPVVESEAKEHAACPRARYGPLLRTTVKGDEEFDGSDGWAVAEDIHVAEAQEWFRKSQKSIQWDTWLGLGLG